MAKHINHSGGGGQGLMGAPVRTIVGMLIISFAGAAGIDYLYESNQLPAGVRQAVDDFARGAFQTLANTILKVTE
ncbi:MAG: hypothetical protein LC110_00435 [Burkholderiales bacterium]|nr:hypothetical protein [Burkholderiales bacterium]